MRTNNTDDEEPDGQLANDAIARLKSFSESGIGIKATSANAAGDSSSSGSQKPFFLAMGLHKPHLPNIVPAHYFDLYDPANISLAPNTKVPDGFQEENWWADGTGEMIIFANNDAAFNRTR